MKASRHNYRRTIQPNYAKWNSVAVGDAYSQVIEVLGEPLSIAGSSRVVGQQYWICYGWVADTLLPCPAYQFILLFDESDHLKIKCDPFDGNLSTNGAPTIPIILLPQMNASFSHVPRVLDLRWAPCSGQDPITYDVELGLGGGRTLEEPKFAAHAYTSETGLKSTHLTINFPGCQPGRFRVRGRNALGVGEWTSYRVFLFTR